MRFYAKRKLMIKVRFVICMLLSGLFLVACQLDDKKAKEGIALNEEGEEVILKNLPLPAFEPMPSDSINKLLEQTDAILLQVLGTPDEMEFTAKTEINRVLGFLSPSPANFNRDCKIAGYFKLISEGKSEYHIDLFTEEGCAYAVIYHKNQAKYAQKLSSEGIQFIQTRANLK